MNSWPRRLTLHAKPTREQVVRATTLVELGLEDVAALDGAVTVKVTSWAHTCDVFRFHWRRASHIA